MCCHVLSCFAVCLFVVMRCACLVCVGVGVCLLRRGVVFFVVMLCVFCVVM